jgi:hypothetical protein
MTANGSRTAGGYVPAAAQGRSDALVFFGATGDLAYKQIFPALAALVDRGRLVIPVIGVAKAGWDRDQLVKRAHESVAGHGGADPGAARRLGELLRYVDGDYRDPGTFQALRAELGEAKAPLHYLAIPPALFSTVVTALDGSGCAEGGRVVAEKPFGHDLAWSPPPATATRTSGMRKPRRCGFCTVPRQQDLAGHQGEGTGRSHERHRCGAGAA